MGMRRQVSKASTERLSKARTRKPPVLLMSEHKPQQAKTAESKITKPEAKALAVKKESKITKKSPSKSSDSKKTPAIVEKKTAEKKPVKVEKKASPKKPSVKKTTKQTPKKSTDTKKKGSVKKVAPSTVKSPSPVKLPVKKSVPKKKSADVKATKETPAKTAPKSTPKKSTPKKTKSTKKSPSKGAKTPPIQSAGISKKRNDKKKVHRKSPKKVAAAEKPHVAKKPVVEKPVAAPKKRATKRAAEKPEPKKAASRAKKAAPTRSTAPVVSSFAFGGGFGVSTTSTTTSTKKPTIEARTEVDLSSYLYGKEPEVGELAGKLDLVFCLDCTGSMSSVISACQSSIVSMANALKEQEGQDVRFCLIPYRDHSVGEVFCTKVYPFTRDVAQMKANVDAQSAGGGGDSPEAVTAAMYEAVCLDWRQDAAKLVVFMADAGPHGLGEGNSFPNGDPDGKDPLALAREMLGLGIAMYSVISGGTETTRHFFAAVAAMTGGQCVALQDASLLAQAILGGARENVDMERGMSSVRAKLLAEAESKGRELTEEEAAAVTRDLLAAADAAEDAAVADGAGAAAEGSGAAAGKPRRIPDDKVIGIPLSRLEQAKAAETIVALRMAWRAGGAVSGPLAPRGEEGLAARMAAAGLARAARRTGKVLVECVHDGKKVRARVVTAGYDPDKNCQFPRGIREEGRRFWVDEVVNAGSFYRCKGAITPAADGDDADGAGPGGDGATAAASD